MKILAKFAVAVLMSLLISGAHATCLSGVSATSELALNDGPTDVQVNDLSVKVIRSFVGTLTAHSYERFTSFVVPRQSRAAWLQVMISDPDNDVSDFRTVESADSTVQSIAMYRSDGALFAVQATKSGLHSPDLYLNQSLVKFTVYKFNGNQDMARFRMERVFESKSKYVNAGGALANEFFCR
jgi:hypothetical protein